MGVRLFVLVSFLPYCAIASYPDEPIGCTAIAIDGAASVDGSAFAGMNADAANADYRLAYVPARQHAKGAMRPVFTYDLVYPRFVGFGRSDLYHPRSGQKLKEPVGHIPEVEFTHGYYESAEPLMNDQGLGFGESSCAAMLTNKFAGDDKDTRDVPTGMLDTVTLMQLSLERCATARCAVELMGELSEAHGFVPTPGEPIAGSVDGRFAFDDAGEAYTVADASGEAWVFHVLGGVKGITKSVWAAQRVPKGHFALVANDFTIGELPEEPNEDFLFNKNAMRAAIAAKLWDGRGAFHFSRTFAPHPMTFAAPAGSTPIPLYASLRRWGLMNLVAPSLKLQFKMNNQDYPFSVKAETKLSHRDVMGFFRYHYQGTEFDLTQGILAGPFNTPFRIEGGPGRGQVPRGISILRTLYGIISQTGPQKQLAWFALDAPLTSVYVPLFAKTSAVSQAYATGYNGEFTRDSAWWAFDFVNNFMQLNYRDSSQQDVYPAIESWQDRIDEQCQKVEHEHAEALGKWQISLQEEVVASWWRLADFLIMKYNDGRINAPTVGKAIGYSQWYADMIGFNNDIHPVSVQPTMAAQAFPLPRYWDGAEQAWSDDAPSTMTISLSSPEVSNSSFPLGLLLGVSIGMIIGCTFKERKQHFQDSYSLLA